MGVVKTASLSHHGPESRPPASGLWQIEPARLASPVAIAAGARGDGRTAKPVSLSTT